LYLPCSGSPFGLSAKEEGKRKLRVTGSRKNLIEGKLAHSAAGIWRTKGRCGRAPRNNASTFSVGRPWILSSLEHHTATNQQKYPTDKPHRQMVQQMMAMQPKSSLRSYRGYLAVGPWNPHPRMRSAHDVEVITARRPVKVR